MFIGPCDLFVELFHGLYCSGSMCVGVTLWFGCGGVKARIPVPHHPTSLGSLVQWLAKNYKNDSLVSNDMDKVSVMTAYSDPVCVCVVHCI